MTFSVVVVFWQQIKGVMMLQEALLARLPVVRATTTDTPNLMEVLEHLVPDFVLSVYASISGKNTGTAHVLVALDSVPVTDKLYTTMVERGQTLLLINQDDPSGLAINVGEVPVPPDMMRELVEGVTSEKKRLPQLLTAFRGLTLKAASEVIRLVLARDQQLTVAGVLRERSQLVGKLKGLSLVDTEVRCYVPNRTLASWVAKERPYFEGATDPRLIPRGLLFDGYPGTGKTQGAKFLARELGVPLYRLDLASSLTKWVGESEANFGRVLSALDQEEPCVFLVDEVEKLFDTESEDAGTTSRILSQLLWWLQEHQSRIITVMTTNNQEKLPAELYRAGRIDTTINFGVLSDKEAVVLVEALLHSFGVSNPVAKIKALLGNMRERNVSRTPANVTQEVLDYLKQSMLCLSNP